MKGDENKTFNEIFICTSVRIRSYYACVNVLQHVNVSVIFIREPHKKAQNHVTSTAIPTIEAEGFN